jgi:hypothetical protein
MPPARLWASLQGDSKDVMNQCYEGLDRMDAMLNEFPVLGLEQN